MAMPNIEAPEKHVKLKLEEHIQVKGRPHYTRIIDPRTGKHEEIMERVIEYCCPVCKTIQEAPRVEGLEYACPKCDFRYKIYHPSLLVLWNPRDVGVETKAAKPGALPPELLIDRGHAQDDPEEGQAEMDRTKADFVGAIVNKEEKTYTNKAQVLVPKDIKKGGDA